MGAVALEGASSPAPAGDDVSRGGFVTGGPYSGSPVQ